MKNTILIIALFSALGIYGQESALLDTNDISARIYSDGGLFNGIFKVPKESPNSTIHSANLWIGGYDEFDNLHLAAQTYYSNQIRDYFYGPIASNYNDSNYTNRYNQVWKINKSTIDYHKTNFNQAGYIVPPSIANWPGNGNTANGEAELLAPFVDLNFNRIFDPKNGDYPDIRGDQAVFFIVNDAKSIHTGSGGARLGIEIHGMAYSFASLADSALNQTIFLNYQVYNRSLIDYQKLFIGTFTDMEIGYYFDDAIGCDSLLNLSYSYNGQVIDSKYGSNPPAQGLIVLNHPMSSFAYYNNASIRDPPPATTDPGTSIEFYRYLTNRWKNGVPLTRGGLGYNPGSIDTAKFAFNGDPNGTGWIDPHPFDEKNGITIIGPFDFKPGSSICMDIAFPYARDYKGTNLSSVSLLKQRVQSIPNFYNNQGFECPIITTAVNENNQQDNLISLYPNPNNGNFQIEFNESINSKNCKVEIYNAVGQKVYQTNNSFFKQFNNLSIDLSSQPTGIYFVKVNGGQKFYSKKIIIQQ